MDEKQEARIRRLANRACVFVAVLAVLKTIVVGLIAGWADPLVLIIPATAVVVIPFVRWFVTWFLLRTLRRRN